MLMSRLGAPAARRDAPLGPLTTYRVGGPARALVEAGSLDDLEAVREAVETTGAPVLIVGKGSNLLVADEGFDGVAVQLGEGFSRIVFDDLTVRAGGGVAFPVLARRTARAGLTGLEWAVGVPGSVGGAVRMNAGGHGASTSEVLVAALVFNLAHGGNGASWVTAADLSLTYRRSSIADTDVVVEAEFALERGEAAACEKRIAEIVTWRRENQPGGQNAGSVFTNPPGEAAGRLVELAGLKGHRLGSAEVSTKHANFIQADSGGSANDVAALIAEVARLVEERLGVRLSPEVRMIGFDEPPPGVRAIGFDR
jgi:UDP-N-acetylmuramate dehydrogenase